MNDECLQVPLNEIPQDRIDEFCQTVVSRHAEKWPLDENTLAEEFLDFFGLRSWPTFEGIAQLCQNRLRITVSFAPLPAGMRGYNGSYGKQREILISVNQDFVGAELHTLLHELREILEAGFAKLERPIANRQDSDLEHRAESFAISLQVCAAFKMLPTLVDNASEIERKWLRIGAYVFLFAGTLVYLCSCAFLPRIEDSFAAQRLAQRARK